MDETTRSILLNKEVIAVDQDRLGVQGHRVCEGRRRGSVGEAARWRRPRVLLFNRGDAPATIRATPISSADPRACVPECETCGRIRDLPRWSGSLEATIEPHGVAMFRIA